MEDICDLAFFTCEVKGVRFYEQQGRRLGNADVLFEPEPTNQHDRNAVLCFTRISGSRVVLGHVAAEAARWLSPLLLGPFSAAG